MDVLAVIAASLLQFLIIPHSIETQFRCPNVS